MKTSKIYKDYPEMPYISDDRDVKAWEENPHDFYYGVIEKKNMVRLSEGILPGHIIMLWRVHFNTFSNETIYPQYFEYRYGVDGDEALDTLVKKGYIVLKDAKGSLDLLNIRQFKEILSKEKLPLSGKRQDLENRVLENVENDKLEKYFTIRKYEITKEGTKLLEKYDSIIQKHGPKKL